MAIAYIGSALVESQSQNVSTSITIPAGATFCVLCAGYDSEPSTITLDGQTCTLIDTVNFNSGFAYAKTYWVAGFSTGSKTFVCDHSNKPHFGAPYMFMFFSGVATSDPIRDHDTSTAGTDITLDSSTTDMLVGFEVSSDCGADLTHTGQTEIYDDNYGFSHYASCYKAGTGATDTIYSEGCNGHCLAVSLKVAEMFGGGAIMF